MMEMTPINILFFSDTHLGFDFPLKPRVKRRRRGQDFFSNYHHILEIGQAKKIDLIIHGGDVFFRSKVPPAIIDAAYEPLLKIANAGIPVYLVPGNHERSKLPEHLWLSHKNIHVFDKPKIYRLKVGEVSIALSGFPFTRNVKRNFQTLLAQTNYHNHNADIHFLCLHQTFEGAKVGPTDFTFKSGADNIPGGEIPACFTAILSGHIHRGQHLTHTLDLQPLPVPVIYSGSIERTSFAERLEDKYFVILKVQPGIKKFVPIIDYHQLPTRPMVMIEFPTQGLCSNEIRKILKAEISLLDPDSIVRIKFKGLNADQVQKTISASYLRSISPLVMNISLPNQWNSNNKRSKSIK